MKAPSIFVVIEERSDGYHLFGCDPVAWFFDEKEADKWAETNNHDPPNSNRYRVEEVPAGGEDVQDR